MQSATERLNTIPCLSDCLDINTFLPCAVFMAEHWVVANRHLLHFFHNTSSTSTFTFVPYLYIHLFLFFQYLLGFVEDFRSLFYCFRPWTIHSLYCCVLHFVGNFAAFLLFLWFPVLVEYDVNFSPNVSEWGKRRLKLYRDSHFLNDLFGHIVSLLQYSAPHTPHISSMFMTYSWRQN